MPQAYWAAFMTSCKSSSCRACETALYYSCEECYQNPIFIDVKGIRNLIFIDNYFINCRSNISLGCEIFKTEMNTMNKSLRVIPFILLVIYYLLIAEANISIEIKYAILLSMVIASGYVFLKTRTQQGWNRTGSYLIAGVLSTLAVSLYFIYMP